jgi:23S rRNA pseudouridine2604 synthase
MSEETIPLKPKLTRINRYLAQNNICSRREADQLIENGKVKVNGRTARLGDRVTDDDDIEVFDVEEKELVYLAFNKPKGVITHSPQRGEKSVGDFFKFTSRVFPVGRLDKDSHGLILLTNDGRLTGKLLDPEHDHEKEYIVRVDRAINEHFLEKLAGSVTLGDGSVTKPCRATLRGEETFSIILTEGKNRQIRRMCMTFHRKVLDLQRIRIMNITLGNLRPGQYRVVKGAELDEFLAMVGMVSVVSPS